jgi:protoheme IX farnesyltransferase
MSDVLAVKPVAGVKTAWRDYMELSKARIVLLVLVTTAAGLALAPGAVDLMLLLNTLLGTALIAGGTNALNQYLERDLDRRMNRTRLRPLPDGRMSEAAAVRFAVTAAVAGAAWLSLTVNPLAAGLALITLVTYLFAYTPLKTRTPLCTLVGAIPGAIPPLIGWAAAAGRLDAGAWVLFALMFLWQLPHFLAIGWIYRDDYARAGFSILSVVDPTGAASGRQALLYGLALVPVSLLPAALGIAGPIYLAAGILAGIVLLGAIMEFASDRNRLTARRLFMTSNVYLIIIMTFLVFNHALS